MYQKPTANSIFNTVPGIAVQLFDLQWLWSCLKMSWHREFGWAPRIWAPVLDEVEVDHEKSGSVPAGLTGAFGGAREAIPHFVTGKAHLTREYKQTENYSNVYVFHIMRIYPSNE